VWGGVGVVGGQASGSLEGSGGGVGERTHLLEEYFVRIKFSIFESEGTWEGGNDASQYLPSTPNS